MSTDQITREPGLSDKEYEAKVDFYTNLYPHLRHLFHQELIDLIESKR